MNLEDCINKEVFDKIYKDHSISIKVHLRGSKTKSANHDPFRNIGYTITKQNPLWVKALKRDLTSNSLIIREMGLTQSGAIEIIVQNKDVSLIKASTRVVVNEIDYYPYNDAVGNKFQLTERPFGYSKIVLFRKKS